MSKGSKRPGWKVIRDRHNRIGRELRAAAEAERKRNPPKSSQCAVTAVASANSRARSLKSNDLCVRCARNSATFTAPATNGSWDAICRPCTTLDDRWFCGMYPCGLVYADRGIEEHGDYKRVAFLSYRTLVLEIDDPSSPLLERVRADAAAVQARRGQPYQVAGNMTITLGE